MRIEAFTEGKNLDDPEANEDQFVVLPGRGYAVIDGVTDITGRTFDGMRTGRLASRLVQRATADFLCHPAEAEKTPVALVERVSTALREEYVRHGMLGGAREDPTSRFGATLTVALDLGATIRFILIGDSGVRINGEEVVVVDSGLDLVTAALRQEAYRTVAEAGGDLAAQRQVSRACSFHGTGAVHPDMQPWLDGMRLASLLERSLARCRARFPSAPVDHIRRLLSRGISGQTVYQNNTDSPFSYATLDGFAIPMQLVHVIDRPRAAVRSLELFTDGYFRPGASAEVTAWERAFEEVERLDPEKIDAHPSVKGSAGRMRTDDRTVVIVHF